MISISALYIYPVKSLAGIQLEQSQLSEFGLHNDRRWLIVDEDGLFMSQRTTPKMATIKTALKDGVLMLSHKDKKIKVPKAISKSKTIQVTVWNDSLNAQLLSCEVDEWLSEILGQTCHLVYMPKSAERQIDKDFAKENQYVSFADAFPLLLVSQASIDDLNKRLETPVNINRFRPNIVVEGIAAFAEDLWKDFTINKVKYHMAKPCSRCIMPSINQQTGKQENVKLLSILNKYRKFDKKIKFAVNILYKDSSKVNNQYIQVGDVIKLN
jgi:uncharacterized protein YcbX